MTNIRAIGNKVLGRMIEPVGRERKTAAGIIITENNMADSAIRNRWFQVISVGPDQPYIAQDQYVLVEHGRWSRGIDVHGTSRPEDFIFNIDADSILGTRDDNPLG